MKSRNPWRFAFTVIVAAGLVLPAALPAWAQGVQDQLMGTYFSTGAQACLASPFGFTNLSPNNIAASFAQSASVQGTFTFHPDGTGTAQFKEMVITHPPVASTGASSTEQSFSFTYSITDDGTLTLVTGSVTGRVLTGSLAGVNFVLDNSAILTGRVAKNGATIMLSTTDPAVELLMLQLPQPVTLPRLCHRSRVLIPVHVAGEGQKE